VNVVEDQVLDPTSKSKLPAAQRRYNLMTKIAARATSKIPAARVATPFRPFASKTLFQRPSLVSVPQSFLPFWSENIVLSQTRKGVPERQLEVEGMEGVMEPGSMAMAEGLVQESIPVNFAGSSVEDADAINANDSTAEFVDPESTVVVVVDPIKAAEEAEAARKALIPKWERAEDEYVREQRLLAEREAATPKTPIVRKARVMDLNKTVAIARKMFDLKVQHDRDSADQGLLEVPMHKIIYDFYLQQFGVVKLAEQRLTGL
jgi:hypothetical protein